MLNGQMVRVQRQILSIKFLRSPVAQIADDRMPMVGQLNTNLVAPPRVQAHLQETAAVSLGQALPCEHGPLAVRLVGSNHAHVPPVLAHVVLVLADAGDGAFHQREVPLGDGPLAELAAEVPGSLRRARKHHQSGRRTIEPVHEPEVRVRRGARMISKPRAPERLHIGIAGPVGLGKQSGQLVDDKQRLVVVYHVKG